VIDIVCRPPTNPKIKIRSTQHTLTKAEIPKNAPIWTLNREALEQLNWENRTIPVYDPTDEEDDDNDEEVGTSSRKRKRKGKGKEKERKNKKSKKK